MGNKDFFAGKAGPEEASPGSPFSNGYHQLMSPYNSYGIPESGPGPLVSFSSFDAFLFLLRLILISKSTYDMQKPA